MVRKKRLKPGRKPYRIETYWFNGKARFYFVKDIKIRGKSYHVRIPLGSKHPETSEEVDRLWKKHARDLEFKAAEKRAELNAPYFNPVFLQQEAILALEQLRYYYQGVKDLMTISEEKDYEKRFELQYVQGTVRIEGNTLTLNETEDLLLHDITPKGKELREINEVQNFKKVIKFRKKHRGKVNLSFIRELHYRIMDNIDLESAGAFRRSDDFAITGCDIKVCPSIVIEEELNKLIEEYYEGLKEDKHPFELATLFHYRFEIIHPFTDGNGRVGREIFNCMLLRAKFPKLLFLGRDRTKYIEALRKGNDEDYKKMIYEFLNIIIKQRKEVLKKNLEQVSIPPKKDAQMRMLDFM